MATYELDELEADEVYHSLLGRKGDLDKIVKNLEERDGLPEAAQATRGRIELYLPNGEGDDKRPGLLRLFAPQRDIEADIQAQRASAGEQRADDGSQDMFGGGAETGGGHPAGEVVPAREPSDEPASEKPKRSRKKKGAPADTAAPQIAAEEVSSEPAEGVDAEALVNGRLEALDGIARDLLEGEPTIDDDSYMRVAKMVEDALPLVHATLDVDYLRAQLYDEFRGSDDNAELLAFFVQRQADQVRDAMTKPIGRREESHPDGVTTDTDGDASEPPEPTLRNSNGVLGNDSDSALASDNDGSHDAQGLAAVGTADDTGKSTTPRGESGHPSADAE